MSPTADLPILIGPPDLLEGPARDGWLDRVRACRHHLLRTWQQQGGRPGPAATAIDQALGLMRLREEWARADGATTARPVAAVASSTVSG